jgi:hypothetical protein
MEPEGSLPSSQELATCTYPEPDQSSPQHWLLSLKDIQVQKSQKEIVCGFLGSATEQDYRKRLEIRANKWILVPKTNNNNIDTVRNICTQTPPRHSIQSTSLPLHSLHFHTTIYPSSLNTTALHFIYFIIYITPSLNEMYHFPNLSLKLLVLQERVPKASAGNWFQSCMVLFRKEYFPTTVLLLSASNFPIKIDPAQIAWLLHDM